MNALEKTRRESNKQKAELIAKSIESKLNAMDDYDNKQASSVASRMENKAHSVLRDYEIYYAGQTLTISFKI